MAGEVDEVVDQAPETQEDAQALADFNAGFEDAPNEPEQTETPVAEQPTEEPKPEEPPAEQPTYVHLTQQQYDDLVAGVGVGKEARKQLDQAFGSIGQMKQAMDQLRAQTAPGQPVEITEEDMADLAAEFPEMTVAALKTFQKVASKLRGTGTAFDPAAIEKVVSERTEPIRAEILHSHLDGIVDGDWQAETKTEPFMAWFNAQGEDIKAKAASDSPRDAAAVLRAWVKAKSAPPPPPAKAPAPAPVSPRTRQLAAAVNPRSIGGAPTGKTPEDEFNEGFRTALNGR